RVSTMATMSPVFASFFSSWTMNFDVRRSVLPYRPCRTCHSTATTQLFCIASLTTTPTFSDFSAISISRGGRASPSCLSCPFLSENSLYSGPVPADGARLVGVLELPHRLWDEQRETLFG